MVSDANSIQKAPLREKTLYLVFIFSISSFSKTSAKVQKKREIEALKWRFFTKLLQGQWDTRRAGGTSHSRCTAYRKRRYHRYGAPASPLRTPAASP